MAESDRSKTLAVEAAIAELMSKVNEINPNFSFDIKRSAQGVGGTFFSDWHDKFKDSDGTFSDGFGKAGG